MPPYEKPPTDLYGSAELLETATEDIRPALENASSCAVPLGFDPSDDTKGVTFNFGPGGDPGHGLFAGTTRSGKMVNVIAPALLTLPNSCVVLDPKLEAAWLTAKYRRETLGHRTVILDPWNEINERYGDAAGETEIVTKFNPLSALNPDDPEFNDDVTAMADAITLNSDQENHWTESAKLLIAGLIAAAVESNPGQASFRYVLDLITSSDEKLVEEIDAIIKRRPKGVAARKLRRFKPQVTKDASGDKVFTFSDEIGSIRSTAETQLEILHSEVLLASMETDDPPFNMADLATDKVTLYLGLPVDKLKTHGRWLRMAITLSIKAISRQKKNRRPEPVLFILDEFGTISPGTGLSMVEQSFGLMAGMGIRIWAFLQDLPQLKRDYPHSWETFISNSSVIQLLNVSDQTTADYFSGYLGTQTINAKTGGWSYKQVRWEDATAWNTELEKRVQARIDADDRSHAQQLAGVDWEFWENHQEKTPSNLRTFDGQAIRDTRGNYTPNPRYTGPAPITPPPPMLPSGNHVNGNRREAYKKHAEEQMTKELAASKDYRMEWVPDEQLASRPVLFPKEIMDSPEDHSIIIMPRKGNYRLRRFEYYSDPVYSTRVRPDPNKPAPSARPRID